MMTANVTPATSEVPDARELSPDELNGVSGGWLMALFAGRVLQGAKGGETGGSGQNDPAQMFQQVLQQMTQG